MPAARLAMRIAVAQALRRAASITASVAITVSPAPLTSYTSRACAGSCSAPLVREQRHALLAARDQQRVEPELRAQLLRRAASGRLRRFQRPTTSRNSARFGVSSVAPRSASSRRPWGRPARACRRARARRIISRDVRRGRPCRSRTGSPTSQSAQRRSKSAQLGGQHLVDGGVSKSMRSSCCWRPITRSLTRGARSRVAMQAGARRRSRSSSRAERCARPRRAPTTDSSAPARAERRAVARHVGRAAGALLVALDQTTGTGASGEMRAHVAEPVAVEHHVADHQHARLLEVSGRSSALLPARSESTRSPARAPWPDRTGCGRRRSPASSASP